MPLPPGTPLDADGREVQQALAGQYVLERELGRGGMGIVYLAREVALDRLVAIKVLPSALSVRAALRERFLREARTAAQLSHPHIVPIYRVGQAETFVYFVMAFIDGPTLAEQVRAHGALPARDVTRVFRNLAWALAYAHARGIVHRDLKPDNILIERDTGRALLTDFGIAQVADAVGTDTTGEGRVMGTAHYMSPEQAAGDAVDGRSDLYALGIVAFFMASGQLPFAGTSAQAVLAQHLTRPAPACPAPGLPGAVHAAIARCLAKAPDDRFATGEALGAVLEDAQQGDAALPVPLRAWVASNDSLAFAYGAWSFFWGTLTTVGLVADFTGAHGPHWRTTALLTIVPLAPLALAGLVRFRRLAQAGFTLANARAALDRQDAERREDLLSEHGDRPTSLGRGIRVATYTVALATIGALVSTAFFPDFWARMATGQVVVTGTVTTIVLGLLGTVFPGRSLATARGATSLRTRLWHSPLGALSARLTAWHLHRGTHHDPHRGTL